MERAAEAAFLALYVPDWFVIGAACLGVFGSLMFNYQAVAFLKAVFP
jgi:hypothetical protein